MTGLRTERENDRELLPFPYDGCIVEETPPCFSWLFTEGVSHYRVEIYRDDQLFWSGETDLNHLIPDRVLEPGAYTWDVLGGGMRRGVWHFTIAQGAPVLKRPDARTVFASVPDVRPRHLFFASDVPALLAEHETEVRVLRRNIVMAKADPYPTPPLYHRDPDALPYREYFGQFRDAADRDLVALALGYALLSDREAGERGRELLLRVCDISPYGPASLLGPYGDEVGLSMARILPAVFDLLYGVLSERERLFVARTVAAYAAQCEERLQKLDYTHNPGDSHAGRLPAYLGEAALSLKGTGVVPEETLLRWLGQALAIYGGIFPFYGGADGGWAEGPFYASSYTRWFLPFFSAVERYTGFSFTVRPFYRHLTRFLLHFADPTHENHPFGDGYWCRSEDPEWPGFFAQDPMRYYAERFGPAEAVRRHRAACNAPYYSLHLLDLFLPASSGRPWYREEPVEALALFPDTGFAAMHTAPDDPETDLCCLIRASRFGSSSHRHPDQGNFALFAGGYALISPSGYFGRQYGSEHHRLWLNSSKAHNVPLPDGKGQYTKSHLCRGRILDAHTEGNSLRVRIEAGSAYAPDLHWERTYMLEGNRLTVTDVLQWDHPFTVLYPLHTLSQPYAQGDSVTVRRGPFTLTVQPQAGFTDTPVLSDHYDVDLNAGEPAAYHVSRPPQYHIYYEAPARTCHTLVMTFTVTE